MYQSNDSTAPRGPLLPMLLVCAVDLPTPAPGAQSRIALRLGAALRVARESRQLSLAALAKCAGLAKSSLYDVERGAADLRVSHLVILGRALNVAPAWLVKVAS